MNGVVLLRDVYEKLGLGGAYLSRPIDGGWYKDIFIMLPESLRTTDYDKARNYIIDIYLMNFAIRERMLQRLNWSLEDIPESLAKYVLATGNDQLLVDYKYTGVAFLPECPVFGWRREDNTEFLPPEFSCVLPLYPAVFDFAPVVSQ